MGSWTKNKEKIFKAKAPTRTMNEWARDFDLSAASIRKKAIQLGVTPKPASRRQYGKDPGIKGGIPCLRCGKGIRKSKVWRLCRYCREMNADLVEEWEMWEAT